MHIIAGKYKRRLLEDPALGSVRPMSHKVRDALFNVLGPIDGMEVIDAYAGSGALGLEAISRGARFVYGIEMDKSAQQTIENNVQELDVADQYRLFEMDVDQWVHSAYVEPARQAQIILADPPYEATKAETINQLARVPEVDSVLALSHGEDFQPDSVDLDLIKSKSYGGRMLSFYRTQKE